MKTRSITLKTLTLAAASVALTPPAEGATYVDVSYQGLSEAISFAHIGDAGNANDTILSDGAYRGSVNDAYYISKYEVTQGQWVDFLNAVATDRSVVDLAANAGIKNLYSSYMAHPNDAWNGIKRTETADTYSYSLLDEDVYAKRPVVYVSLLSAKRFCNWLTNGGGSTETGVYDLGGGANSERGGVWGTDLGAVALPTENEWYKAAYYDSNKGGTDVGGYYQYSFGHANGDTISTSYANYDYSYENGAGGGTYALSPVDHYEGLNASLSAYGVADMTGNVWEWTDSQYNTFSRVVRGSAYYSDAADLAAGSSWLDLTPGDGYGDLGFRVASLAPIPEPSTYGMIGGALVGLLCLLRRKKRAVAP